MSTFGTDTFDEVIESFEILRDECPLQYEAIARRLTDWPVLLTIGTSALSFTADALVIHAARLAVIEPNWVRIRTNTDCIRAVANGHRTLAEVVEDPLGGLWIRGPVDGVAAAFDSVADYVDGALRCPDLETKLDRFLETA